MSKAMEDRINERVKIIVLKMLADGNLFKEQIAAFTDLTAEQIECVVYALRMIRNSKLSDEEISKVTELTFEEVKELKAQASAVTA